MKKIIITQRIERFGKHKELRDCLDIKLANLFSNLGYIPVPLPNKLKNINMFFKELMPKGIILSGGGNPLSKDLRYKNEKVLIDLSIKNKVPLLGICRGAQRINIHFNGKLKKIKNHTKKKHLIYENQKQKGIKVNSYHDFGFSEKMLGKNLKSLAQSQDRIIEYFEHTNYKIAGIMWHPEREKILKKFDKKIIKGLIR